MRGSGWVLIVNLLACEKASPVVEDPQLIAIPEGELVLGCIERAGMVCSHLGARPRAVRVPAFSISRTEITVRNYRACVEAGACTGMKYTRLASEDYPVRATWSQAQAYCVWKGWRLPYEDEWERAARGDDNRFYPWGDSPPDCNGDDGRWFCKHQELHPAGSLPRDRSPFGVMDMLGNSGEWVFDMFGWEYRDGRVDAAAGEEDRVRKADGDTAGPLFERRGAFPFTGTGFRCATDGTTTRNGRGG
jgi:sulfatase modifying factor 1